MVLCVTMFTINGRSHAVTELSDSELAHFRQHCTDKYGFKRESDTSTYVPLTTDTKRVIVKHRMNENESETN